MFQDICILNAIAKINIRYKMNLVVFLRIPFLIAKIKCAPLTPIIKVNLTGNKTFVTLR